MTIRDIKLQINTIEARRNLHIDYMHAKIQDSDWHGVADAAMDIREYEAQLYVLRQVEANHES